MKNLNSVIFIIMKIILTENQLTDLIKNTISKATGISKKEMNMKDILKNLGIEPTKEIENLFGKIDLEKDKGFKSKTKFGDIKLTDFTGEQRSNIKKLIDNMNDKGITDPNTQIGILSVIGKESGFIPQSEGSYTNTPNSRIKNIFGNRVPNDDLSLNKLKNNPKKFFDKVYGGRFGNDSNEGYKYRGRGFNQLTFKGNYQKYGSIAGVNIVSDPDSLNDIDTASKVAIAFFTKGKPASSFPDFNSKEDAAKYFSDLNAGGVGGSHRQKSIDISKKFST